MFETMYIRTSEDDLANIQWSMVVFIVYMFNVMRLPFYIRTEEVEQMCSSNPISGLNSPNGPKQVYISPTSTMVCGG